MAQNFICEGERIDYVNNTGSAILAGDVVPMGKAIGVSYNDIADTETGAVALEGVWLLPKTTSMAMTQGAMLYWSVGTTKVTTTASGNQKIGVCFVAAASNDTTVQVRLNEAYTADVDIQATVVVALTDNGGGASADGTIAAIPAATAATTDTSAASLTSTNTSITAVKDAVKELSTEVNAILSALKTAGIMASA